jgi:hypothetical protein
VRAWGQDGFTPLRLAHHGEHAEAMDAIQEAVDTATLEEDWGRMAQVLLARLRSAWFQHRQEGATSELMAAGTLSKREHQRRIAASFPAKMLYYRSLRQRFGAGSFAELALLDMDPELREEVRVQARAALRAGGGYRSEGCAACGASKEAGMLRCSRCAKRGVVVYYCGAACQKAHWPAHKAECRA